MTRKTKITLEISPELARLIHENRGEFKRLVDDFLLAATQADNRRKYAELAEEAEERRESRQEAFKRLGRSVYRLYRQWHGSLEYRNHEGVRRLRGNQPAAHWRSTVLTDIAVKLEIAGGGTAANAALSKFRRELNRKVQRRRAITVFRLVMSGWTNAEIGARLGYHPHSITRICQKNREFFREYRVAHRDFKPIPRPKPGEGSR